MKIIKIYSRKNFVEMDMKHLAIEAGKSILVLDIWDGGFTLNPSQKRKEV